MAQNVLVKDLMSSPPVTCDVATSLGAAARAMRDANVGSTVVVEHAKAIGILTERDLLRATAAGADSAVPVGEWMTPHPDVLGPGEAADRAWETLTGHHYRHLPVVQDDAVVGVVSIRDLLGAARVRPAGEHAAEVPPGLEGVVAARTAVGDVRGQEGFYHYRQYSAVELAASRSFEDVWHLLVRGTLPDTAEARAWTASVASQRALPPGLERLLPLIAARGDPLAVLRSAVSILGSELGWAPSRDVGASELAVQAVRTAAVVPTILTAAYRLGRGLEPVPPRPDLGHAANYLWMLTAAEPDPDLARAVEEYLILTIDHGFNASTFTARVVASTGADLAAAVCAAVGALSGPLHGGAPSRALDMLDAIGRPELADAWVRDAVSRGDRIMGFGHRVYRTEDPRSRRLQRVAARIEAPLLPFAVEVERTVVDVLRELKPGRELYANVEFYAGVVMDGCGIPRSMFTPTFAASRVVGWTAHVLEQAADNRIFRPSAQYVGPPPPAPVPAPGTAG